MRERPETGLLETGGRELNSVEEAAHFSTHTELVDGKLGTLSKKKNDIIWEFFPNVGPPPPTMG